MDYKSSIKQLYESLKEQFNKNRMFILSKFPYKEYQAIGESACYFYITNEFEDTEIFYEEAIAYLEDATLTQRNFIEDNLSTHVYNHEFDTKFIKGMV